MTTSISRLQLLRGDFSGKKSPLRPPWAKQEAEFIASCERCGECIKACPEKILEIGRGHFPQINFQLGECTFCGLCVEHCPNDSLQQTDALPWQIKAHIEAHCLPKQGVICITCGENCEAEAIHFPLSRIAVPEVNHDKCTGCGACYQACPVTAIVIL